MASKAGVQGERPVKAPYSRFQRREDRRAEEVKRGCTAETERCQTARSYFYDLPACCRGHVTRLVFEVGDAMTAAGVRWWLDYGTLLGAVRNPLLGIPGGIIPHDKDADLGFLAEDWEKVLALAPRWTPDKTAGGKDNEVGQALGLYWIHKLARRENRKRTEHAPDGLRHRRHFVSVDRCKGREFPESKLLPLGTIEWEGRQLPCPADPEWFVQHRYGKNWRTPLRRNNDGMRRPGEAAQYGAGDSMKVCLSKKNRTNVDIFPWYDRPYL